MDVHLFFINYLPNTFFCSNLNRNSSTRQTNSILQYLQNTHIYSHWRQNRQQLTMSCFAYTYQLELRCCHWLNNWLPRKRLCWQYFFWSIVQATIYNWYRPTYLTSLAGYWPRIEWFLLIMLVDGNMSFFNLSNEMVVYKFQNWMKNWWCEKLPLSLGVSLKCTCRYLTAINWLALTNLYT